MARSKTRFLLSLVLLIPFASAQFDGGSNAWGIFEAIFNVTVSSPGDMITYVFIPMVAFYAILRVVTELPFKAAGENWKNKTGVSMDSSVTRRSAKALAFVGALALTRFIGEASLALMLFLGLIALAGFALKITGKGFFALLGFANKTGDGVSEGTKSIGKTIQKIGGGIKDLKSKEDQTAQEERNGANPHQLAQEINLEEKEMEQILSGLESVESRMEQKLSEIKKGEDYLMQEEQQEESELEDAQRIEKQALTDLQEFLQDLKQRAQNAQGMDRRDRFDEDSQIANELVNQLQEFKELEDVFRKEYDVHQRLLKYIQELQALRKEAQELDTEDNQLQALIKELEEEEVTAEKIARQYNDEQDWEVIKQEEQELQSIIKEMKNALDEKQRIDRAIKEEIDELKQERRYDQKEVQEIKQILQELRQEESMLNEIRQIYENTWMDSRLNEEVIPQFEESLHKIQNDTQALLNTLSQMEN